MRVCKSYITLEKTSLRKLNECVQYLLEENTGWEPLGRSYREKTYDPMSGNFIDFRFYQTMVRYENV